MNRTTMLSILLAVGTGLALFVVKYQVQDLEDELTGINRDIARNRQAVHVLEAEWSHLNEPNRLKLLATRFLGLKPLQTEQIARPAGLLGDINDTGENQKPDFAERVRRALENNAPQKEAVQ